MTLLPMRSFLKHPTTYWKHHQLGRGVMPPWAAAQRWFASFLHPLDPLSAPEIQAASKAIQQEHGKDLRFVAISLKEPPKKDYVDWMLSSNDDKNKPLARQAEVVTLHPSSGLAAEWVVDVQASKVIQEKQLPAGVQPLLTPDDCDLAESIVQSSQKVAQVLQERYGITDIARQVACDPWSVHLASKEDQELTQWRTDKVPGRLVQTFLYQRMYGDGLEGNCYSHPIDIVPVIDLNAQQVVRIDGLDRQPPPKVPTQSVQYHRNLIKTNSYLTNQWRQERLAALDVVQPDGPSFDVNGNLVTWQGWSFRVGFNYREGLVLQDVHYQGRPVMHRASLVEMAVPYADPHPPFQRKCAFDVGDYGLGYCANELTLGCDCLGHIHYFDATLSDAQGNPVQRKNVVCMHEEDNGILWKHVEYRNGHNEARRSRELIVSSIATVVNYEYLFYWHFRQDGCIDFKIKLSGELSTNALGSAETASGGNPTHGTLVAPNVNAQIHQHMFCARLDMAVDSYTQNTVSEVDVVMEDLDETSNPYGNCFQVHETPLTTESQGQRLYDANKARTWKISNASGVVNKITGKPTAYKLIPFAQGPAQPPLLTHPTSAVAQKGAFATKHLWVTPHADDERYPAGEYTVQGDGSDGLPDWMAADRKLDGEDVVLWHAFGVAHVPRPEDFPVMPCEITGFTLKPDGFFEGNPAIDLPPDTNQASKLAEACCGTKKT